jgi:hypothetical protein
MGKALHAFLSFAFMKLYQQSYQGISYERYYPYLHGSTCFGVLEFAYQVLMVGECQLWRFETFMYLGNVLID